MIFISGFLSLSTIKLQKLFSALTVWYLALRISNSKLSLRLQKIFKKITGRALYENRLEPKDEIIDDWIDAFDDLPEEIEESYFS